MEKKICKHLFGKPVHFSVKNTANNADTWGFIQQYFQHLYRTANSIVHLMVWVKTTQICSDIGNSIFRLQLRRVVLGPRDQSWDSTNSHI